MIRVFSVVVAEILGTYFPIKFNYLAEILSLHKKSAKILKLLLVIGDTQVSLKTLYLLNEVSAAESNTFA